MRVLLVFGSGRRAKRQTDCADRRILGFKRYRPAASVRVAVCDWL